MSNLRWVWIWRVNFFCARRFGVLILVKSLRGCEKWILPNILKRYSDPKNSTTFFCRRKNYFFEDEKIFFEKFQISFSKKKLKRYSGQKKISTFFCHRKKYFFEDEKIFFRKFSNSFSKKNIPLGNFPKGKFFLLEKIFFHIRVFFRWQKKLGFFLDHYIALQFYEEAIFRILGAIWQVWALQIF